MKYYMKQYVTWTITTLLLITVGAWADTSPVSPVPIPAVYPNASNTGLAGVGLTKADLTVYTGSMPLKGVQVFDKVSFPNGVVLDINSNVTFRKCFIGGVKYGVKMYNDSKVLLEDCTLVGGNNPDRLGAGVRPSGGCTTTILRCDVSHYCDGLKLFSNTTVKDSYVHNLHKNSLSHNDGMQSSTNANNIVVSHNTVQARYRQNQSSIRLVAVGGSLKNILVEKNYLSGGQWPLEANAKEDKGGICPAPDFVIQYNVIEKDSWDQSLNRSAFHICGNPTRICNYHHDGTPIGNVGGCTFKDALAAAGASGGTNPPPGPDTSAQTLTIQAEAMTLSGGYLVDNGAKLNGAAIVIDATLPVPTTGTATGTFPGETGIYTIIVSAIPENDGEPSIKLSVAGVEVLNEVIPLDLKNVEYISRHDFTVQNITINAGDEIKIEGTSNRGTGYAGARVDNITFVSTGSITALAAIQRTDNGLQLLSYPQPMTLDSRISFAVERAGFVSLRLYTLSGREVHTLAAGTFTQGSHQIDFVTDELDNGVYLTRLESAQGVVNKEMILVK